MTNSITIIGTVSRYPEFSQHENDNDLIEFSLDVLEQKDGEQPGLTRYDVQAWNELGDAVYYTAQAGGELKVEGWETTQTVIDKDGNLVTRRIINMQSFAAMSNLSSKSTFRKPRLTLT